MASNSQSGLKSQFNALFGKERPGPSYPKLPEVNTTSGESQRPGLYVSGEAAGDPLLKVGLNAGYDWIEHIAPELESYRDKGEVEYDVIIIGCGATGFAAANRAHERGLSYLVLESERFCTLVQNFTKGKPLFNEPHSLEQKGSIWFEECNKEELLEQWNAHRERISLNLHEFEKVTDITGGEGVFAVHSEKAQYTASRVLIAIGKSGNPRKAGVPGESENAQKIYHFLADPDVYREKNILIYGGGDVAAEATLALCDHNSVTLATIDQSFIFPKKRNIDAMLAKQEEGKLTIHYDTRLAAIEAQKATLQNQSTEEKWDTDNDVVFEMIGAIPSLGFFKKVGLQLANSWTGNPWIAGFVTLASLAGLIVWAWEIGAESAGLISTVSGLGFLGGLALLAFMGTKGNRWAWLGLTLLISYTMYAAKTSSPHFPFHWIGAERIAAYLGSGIIGWFVPKAVIALQGAPSFWYSALYTFLVVFFGIKAMKRWGTSYNDDYQKKRYLSIMAFQVVFFIVVNLILSVVIGEYYWRGWGLYQPFPLFFNTFFWWYPGDPQSIKWFFIGFGLFLTFILIPVFVRRHGMRFCTWVCGCGGLAETLGDTWRHLAPKGAKSQKWEFMGPLMVVWAFISLAVIALAFGTDGNNIAWKSYDYIVDFWLVAVIPIGLYPFFGGKVWCRYWCPLAHYMKFLSKWYGKLQIVSNNKCITCTQCSKYCQVGVDVMHFAKNQIPFDNTNSSCIHCGICITVCPVDVLSFHTLNGKEPALPSEPGLKIEKPGIELLGG